MRKDMTTPLHRDLFPVEKEWIFRIFESVDKVTGVRVRDAEEAMEAAQKRRDAARVACDTNPRYKELYAFVNLPSDELKDRASDVATAWEELQAIEQPLYAAMREYSAAHTELGDARFADATAKMEAAYVFGTGKGFQAGFQTATEMTNPSSSWANEPVGDMVAKVTRFMTDDAEAQGRAADVIGVLNEDFTRTADGERYVERTEPAVGGDAPLDPRYEIANGEGAGVEGGAR